MFGVFSTHKPQPCDAALLPGSPTPAVVMPSIQGKRQSKRKRTEVSYLVPDEDDIPELEADDESIDSSRDDDNDEFDDDNEFVPGKRDRKKLKRTRQAKKPKTEKLRDCKPFPFLSLPPELRDMIYELALGMASSCLTTKRKSYCRGVVRTPETNRQPEPGTLYTRLVSRNHFPEKPTRNKKDQRSSLALGLLATNKQIHNETVGMLYGRRINVDSTYTLFTFLANIGYTNRRRLTHISIREYGEGRGAHKAMNYAAMAMLQDCTNLKSLVFDCTTSYRSSAKNVAGRIFRDGHLFLEAFGLVHGRRDAALDILHVHPKNFTSRGHPYRWHDYRQGHADKQDDLEILPEVKEEFETEMRKLLGC